MSLHRRFPLTKENLAGVVQALAIDGDTSLQARDAKVISGHFLSGGPNVVSLLDALAQDGVVTWATDPRERAMSAVAEQIWGKLLEGLHSTWDELLLAPLDRKSNEHLLRLYAIFGSPAEEIAKDVPTLPEEAPLGWMWLAGVMRPDYEAELPKLARFWPEIGTNEIYLLVEFLGGKHGLTFDQLAEFFNVDGAQCWVSLGSDETPRDALASVLAHGIKQGEFEEVGKGSKLRYRIRHGLPPDNAMDVFLDVWPWQWWQGPEPKAVTAVAARKRCSKSNISDHFRTLIKAGLLEKVGRLHQPTGDHPVPVMAGVVATLARQRMQLPAEKRTPVTLKDIMRHLAGEKLHPLHGLSEEHWMSLVEALAHAGLAQISGERRRRERLGSATVELTLPGWMTVQGCSSCASPLLPNDEVLATPAPDGLAWTQIVHANCATAKDRQWEGGLPTTRTRRQVEERLDNVACGTCRGPLWHVSTHDGLEDHGVSGGGVGAALIALSRLCAIARDAPRPPVLPNNPAALLAQLAVAGQTWQQKASTLARLTSWCENVDLGPAPNREAWLATLHHIETRYHKREGGISKPSPYNFWDDDERTTELLENMVWRAARAKRSEPARGSYGEAVLRHTVCEERTTRDDEFPVR